MLLHAVSQRLVFASFFVVLLSGMGCYQTGPPLGYVEGTVTLDGQPIEGLTLRFVPKGNEGTTSYAETDVDGNYTARFTFRQEGVLIGEHDVVFERPIGADERGIATFPKGYERRNAITTVVDSGYQTIDFELKSDFEHPSGDRRRK
ncbi:hypothetical protein [Bremerella alba]|uniref:Carboxypeptidase regulatory-like domain-containing protein n=1 Tax=Bremerella alba TaxID=980252 RepID=A0A7V8V6R8_9BACT|nr:hypothetical protein [Bremerella alba]MBA2115920.1 hypothetical protein [Bremerella alba]